MPAFDYVLRRSFSDALLVLEDRDIARVLLLCDMIARAPGEYATRFRRDERSRMICVHESPDFLISYQVNRSEHEVSFVALTPLHF